MRTARCSSSSSALSGGQQFTAGHQLRSRAARPTIPPPRETSGHKMPFRTAGVRAHSVSRPLHHPSNFCAIWRDGRLMRTDSVTFGPLPGSSIDRNGTPGTPRPRAASPGGGGGDGGGGGGGRWAAASDRPTRACGGHRRRPSPARHQHGHAGQRHLRDVVHLRRGRQRHVAHLSNATIARRQVYRRDLHGARAGLRRRAVQPAQVTQPRSHGNVHRGATAGTLTTL